MEIRVTLKWFESMAYWQRVIAVLLKPFAESDISKKTHMKRFGPRLCL
jgi:hypothetical protein